MKFQFGTKAATLNSLRGVLKHSLVCDSFVFTVMEWKRRQESLVAAICKQFSPHPIIVRSSAINEDDDTCTMAGAYLSVKDVDSSSGDAVVLAIQEVIASYGDMAIYDHEILIQQMIDDVSMSGVVFSHDLTTGAPYYIINYDDTSGKTDTVTSGSTDTSRTLLIHRSQVELLQSPRFRALLRSVQEIEALVPSPGLDLEFAVTRSEEIYVFQVRRISLRQNWNRDITRNIEQIHDFLVRNTKPKLGVVGQTTVFGEMPDWNPAEMIGTVPRPLARSLYQSLITDSVWAEARAEMGYRDLSGHPLMVSMGGRVFVDVRESLNSFLPADLPEPIAEKLANAWLARLKEYPELHDKVEFEVMVTAYTLDFEDSLARCSHSLSQEEIACFGESLRRITLAIIKGDLGSYEQQQKRLKELAQRRTEITNTIAPNGQLLVAVRRLLNDCKRLGTLPFAILARQGFIAEAMLRSLVKVGALTEERASVFRHSVPTVLSEFMGLMYLCQRGTKEWSEFFATYGHLRPGTYDILASRYDQHSELANIGSPESLPVHRVAVTFTLGDDEESAISAALSASGMDVPVARLFEFMRNAIAGREYAKLVFTRNVSDVLELIAEWGVDNGLNRDELSFLTIDEILDTLTTSSHQQTETRLREVAREAQRAYNISQAIRLPYLVSSPSDIYIVPLLKSRANFVTSQRIQAPLHYVSDHALQTTKSAGKVVLIERADPGYDWVFLSPIAGLITKYGGSNSHMAIRCAELNIPAAIGCGEQMFDQLQRSASVLMDCAAGILIPVR
jgi:glutamine kinase